MQNAEGLRERYLICLGEITIRLAQIDWIVNLAIKTLANPGKPERASLLIKEIMSLSRRLDLLKKLGDEYAPPQLGSDLDTLIKRIRDVEKRRNDLFHKPWFSLSSGKPLKYDSKLQNKRSSFKAISLAEVETLTKMSKETLSKLFDFHFLILVPALHKMPVLRIAGRSQHPRK